MANKTRKPLAAPRKATPGTAKDRAPVKRRRAAKAPRRGLLGWALLPLRWMVRLTWALAWRGAVVLGLILAVAIGYNYTQIPDLATLSDGRARGSVTLLDRRGDTFAWRGDQFGGLVTTDGVSRHLVDAVVASEDKRFRFHPGVDPRGIAGAIRSNLASGKGPFSGAGGSTLTQQVAKLLCLGNDWDPSTGVTEAEFEADCRRGTIWRKLQEVPYAMALEAKFTKDDILSIYLNRAYLGAGARGFAAASQRYFGKSVARLTPAEAAMLSGLLPAPSYYAPTNNLQRAQDRAATVLRLMRDQGYLSTAEFTAAIEQPATLSPAARQDTGGYFADWVVRSGPDFLTSETTEDVSIRTTLDQRIQRAAEEAVDYIFTEKVRAGSEAQAAVVVMSADGAVRAMVGGRNTRGAGQFNRAIQAVRQTGSAFKPFVYAAALDLGWNHYSVINDGPLAISVPGSGTYSPSNYTNRFYGNVTLTEALQRSLNAATVRLSEEVGRDIVRNVARDFGIDSDLAAGPALALGVSESTLLEMTGAYAGILNGGTSVTPYGISTVSLRGDDQPLLDHESGLGERVIGTEAARQLVYMMHEVVEQGTGTRAKLPGGRPAAGKTGTTQAARDAWFIGFTGDYVAGVWMGYDDNSPLTNVTGGGLPADIWHEVMTRVHDGLPITQLPMIRPGGNAPAPAPAPQVARPAPTPAPAPQGDNIAERVLLEVLGGFLNRE